MKRLQSVRVLGVAFATAVMMCSVASGQGFNPCPVDCLLQDGTHSCEDLYPEMVDGAPIVLCAGDADCGPGPLSPCNDYQDKNDWISSLNQADFEKQETRFRVAVPPEVAKQVDDCPLLKICMSSYQCQPYCDWNGSEWVCQRDLLSKLDGKMYDWELSEDDCNFGGGL